jgi:hypothetical protein
MSLPLTYKDGQCFFNAFINKRHTYKDKNLRYVIGSVSFNGFFEFGGKTWGLADFVKKHTPGCPPAWDAHAWLEDDDGNIYDYIFPHYNCCAVLQTGSKMKVADNTLWEGISPSNAKKMGVEYVKADKETQTAIFISLYKHCVATEEGLQKGTASWEGSHLLFNMNPLMGF